MTHHAETAILQQTVPHRCPPSDPLEPTLAGRFRLSGRTMAGEWFRTGWRNVVTEPSVVHVRPIGDLVPHDLTDDCICGPTLQIHQHDDAPDGHVYTHHAIDGRE